MFLLSLRAPASTGPPDGEEGIPLAPATCGHHIHPSLVSLALVAEGDLDEALHPYMPTRHRGDSLDACRPTRVPTTTCCCCLRASTGQRTPSSWNDCLSLVMMMKRKNCLRLARYLLLLLLRRLRRYDRPKPEGSPRGTRRFAGHLGCWTLPASGPLGWLTLSAWPGSP